MKEKIKLILMPLIVVGISLLLFVPSILNESLLTKSYSTNESLNVLETVYNYILSNTLFTGIVFVLLIVYTIVIILNLIIKSKKNKEDKETYKITNILMLLNKRKISEYFNIEDKAVYRRRQEVVVTVISLILAFIFIPISYMFISQLNPLVLPDISAGIAALENEEYTTKELYVTSSNVDNIGRLAQIRILESTDKITVLSVYDPELKEEYKLFYPDTSLEIPYETLYTILDTEVLKEKGYSQYMIDMELENAEGKNDNAVLYEITYEKGTGMIIVE